MKREPWQYYVIYFIIAFIIFFIVATTPDKLSFFEGFLIYVLFVISWEIYFFRKFLEEKLEHEDIIEVIEKQLKTVKKGGAVIVLRVK